MRGNKSKLTVIICCVLIVTTAFFKPRWAQKQSAATISWDVSGYYTYLPALFIYKDIKKLDFLDSVSKKYNPTPGYVNANECENGNRVIVYPAGQAISYTPAFLLAHLFASFSSTYLADGYSLPYQVCLSWWSMFIGFIGLLYLRKNLLNYFSDEVTSVCLIILVFGTNYLNYVAFDHAMTHNYLFTYYAILIFYTQKLYQSPNFKYAILVGVLLGIIILTRPSEIIAVFIPLLWGVASKNDMINRLSTWKQHDLKIIATFCITFLIGCIQFGYWKYLTGDFLFYSYQENGFDWLHPNFYNVFFSFKKGWLVYTPLISLSLIGLFPLYQKHRPLFPAIICFLIFNTYIICSWEMWWYGGSFGQRAMMQSYALLIFPMAAFIQRICYYRWLIYGLSVCVVAGITLNLFQMWQVHEAVLDSEGITKAYYKRIFLNTNVLPKDRLLLDIKTDYDGNRKNIIPIFNTSFEKKDSVTTLISGNKANTGAQSTFVNDSSPYSYTTKINIDPQSISTSNWLRVGASFFPNKKEWTEWKMPQFIVKLYDTHTVVAEEKIRPNRIFFENEWKEVHMDFPVPKKRFNKIEIFLWKPSSDTNIMYMDDLFIEIYEPE